MSEDQAGPSKPVDPFERFRSMRDAYLDDMAKVMVEAVNTEAYAQASGAMLENSLKISAPFREVTEKAMLQALQQLSLPSRQDFAVLADRFTNLEMRLDDMDAKLDRIEKHTSAARPVASREPVVNASDSTVKAQSTKPATAKATVGARRAVKQAQPHKPTARKVTR
jgi:hypothetical protein